MQRQWQRLVLTVELVCRRKGLDRPLLKSIIFRFLDTFPRLVVAGSLDGEVLVTRLGRLNAGFFLTGQQIRLSHSPGQAVHSVVVAKVGPSGERTIATGSADGSVRLFAEDASLLLRFQAYPEQPVLSLQLGRVGGAEPTLLATATGGTVAREEGELFDAAHLWEFEDTRKVPRAACALQHGLGVNGIAMSVSKQRLATACDDRSAAIFDFSGRRLVTCRGHLSFVWEVALSPNADFLATACEDGQARLFDGFGQLLRVFAGQGSCVEVILDQDARMLVATAGNCLHVWSWARGAPLVARHSSAVHCAAAVLSCGCILCGTDEGDIAEWSTTPTLVEEGRISAFGSAAVTLAVG